MDENSGCSSKDVMGIWGEHQVTCRMRPDVVFGFDRNKRPEKGSAQQNRGTL